MRVLVVGGTGFIGSHVVGRLVEEGHAVTVLARGTTGAAPPEGVGWLRGDRDRAESWRRRVASLRPDCVVDMISLTGRQARALVDALRDSTSRLVCVSSIDVYRAYGVFRRLEPGPPEPVPLTEDSPLRTRLYPYRRDPPSTEDNPEDDYDKIPVERCALASAHFSASVVRLPMVYGPGDPQHRLRDMVGPLREGLRELVLEERWGAWRSCWGYVGNVADAIARIATDARAAGRVYHTAELESLPMSDRAREIGRLAGLDVEVRVVPEAQRGRRGAHASLDLSQHLVCDSSRIRRELDYAERVATDDALRRTIEWEWAQEPE